MRARLDPRAVLVLCLFLATAGSAGETHLGAYGHPEGPMVIVTRWGDDLYLLDMVDGQARRLAQSGDSTFDYGPTRSSTEPAAGQVSFETNHAGEVTGLTRVPTGTHLSRIALTLTPVEFDNGDEAHLAGTLIQPPTEPKGWILYLNGDGPNPRWDGWDVAAWLGAHGIGTLIFDQRGAGESTGEEIRGNYYARSMVAASDAVAAMRFLRTLPATAGLPVGVGGHSQGGWLGAIVAREIPETDFYINLAGNGSPGWDQWRHAMTTWLHRKQVPLEQIELANDYFDAFFGVYHQKVDWNDYKAALDKARSEAWWPTLKERYVAEFESLDEAREYAASEGANVPANDFRQVAAPSLGLFFEHDHSTTPNTPHIFLEALLAGGNGDVTVRVSPGGDHGGWVVDGFRMDRSQITRRLTEHLVCMRDWILSVAAGRESPG